MRTHTLALTFPCTSERIHAVVPIRHARASASALERESISNRRFSNQRRAKSTSESSDSSEAEVTQQGADAELIEGDGEQVVDRTSDGGQFTGTAAATAPTRAVAAQARERDSDCGWASGCACGC